MACGMMGFTPDQVRAMSLAEVMLAIGGFVEMRRAEAGVDDDEFPTQEEHDAIMALIS